MKLAVTKPAIFRQIATRTIFGAKSPTRRASAARGRDLIATSGLPVPGRVCATSRGQR